MADHTDQELPKHLQPSKLGTKAYWDESYAAEISNNAANGDDEGTIWFSDSGAEEKMIDYLESLSDEGQLFKSYDDAPSESEPTNFLDLGTGNGHLLFALRDAGWEGHMVGVDYSPKSVVLARQIAKSRSNESEHVSVHFEEYDILSQSSTLPSAPDAGFDILLDKGTFDAISLSADTDAEGRRICETYAAKILPLVRREGLFIITSCNWTEEELKAWFEKDGMRAGSFMLVDRIKYPSFTFGGKKGQTVVTVVFKNIGRK